MNKDEIIKMAKQAGFERLGHDEHDYVCYPDDIVAFATLVASAEREECKKLCTWKTGNQFVDEAVAVCYRAIDQRGQE